MFTITFITADNLFASEIHRFGTFAMATKICELRTRSNPECTWFVVVPDSFVKLTPNPDNYVSLI